MKRLVNMKRPRKKTSIIQDNKRNQVGSTDEFTASRTKLDTEDIIYCRIVLTHLLYNDAKRE